ncbi:MAG: IclR family transcriptional regulator [Rhizomicrobium sp.]
MGDSSGPNSRAINVINFLAAHPADAFTLSELAEQLDLSLGSAHRVLTTLVDARYLSRHAKHKTYSLGVALVAIGHAALEKHRSIDIARREMARLTDELKVQCIAAAVVDDELLFLAKEGIPQTHDGLSRVGERRPFIPPLGLAHVAWADEGVVEAFLAKAPSNLNDRMRVHLRNAVGLVRERGYAIAANGPALRALRQTSTVPIGYQRDETYWSRVHTLIATLSEAEVQLLSFEHLNAAGVCYISAPVFSPTGDVALELTLSGMPLNLSAEEIERYAERLRTAAAVITSETHGRMPR